MRLKTIIFLIFVSAQVFGQAKSIYEKTADSLTRIGQPEKLIPYLEGEVKMHPKNEMLLRFTGYTYLQLGNLQLGEKYYRAALALNPACARCYLNIGRAYAAKSEFKQALAYLDKAVAEDPDDYLNYLNRAEINFELENMDASCQDYTKGKMLVLKLGNYDAALMKQIEESMQDFCDPSRASFYYQRGIAYYNLKAYGKALEIYAAGLQKYPENSMILSFQGNAYLALKEYKKAQENYRLALANKENLLTELELNPRFAKVGRQDLLGYYSASIASIYYNDAECKIYEQNLDQALISINEAIALVSDQPGLNKEAYHNRRGEIYLTNNLYNFALADFNASIQINKNYAAAYINRAIAKVSVLDKFKKSKAIISAKFSNQPFRSNWFLKDTALSTNGKASLRAALDDCNRGIALDDQIGFAYYVRGQVKRFLGDKDYCLDLNMAKKLGIEVETALFSGCQK